MGKTVETAEEKGPDVADVSKTAATEEQLRIHNNILQNVVRYVNWLKYEQHQDVDAVLYARLVITSFTQYAAMVAVDLGMPRKQYEAVCLTTFDEAYEKAPKFGD